MFTNACGDKNGQSVCLPVSRQSGNEGMCPLLEQSSHQKRAARAAFTVPKRTCADLSLSSGAAFRDLRHGTAERILKERGYCTDTSEKCVVQLIRRLCEYEEFPHEIGLFLGYPPEDVCGFIENKAGGCKCAGCWKVYGDADAARKTFAKYKKCSGVYAALYANGTSIERLTVAG